MNYTSIHSGEYIDETIEKSMLLNSKIEEQNNTTISNLNTVSSDLATSYNTTKTAVDNKLTAASVTDAMFPVGSMYITSTCENPQSYLGGSWQLIDKQYKSQHISSGIFTINTTNTSSLTSEYAVLGDHSIRIRINLVNKVALTDSTLTMGTISYDAIGLVGGIVTATTMNGYTETGNGVPIFQMLSSTGKTAALVNYDFCSDAANIPASSSIFYDILVTVPIGRMKDSFCDKFVWRRV